VAQDLFRPEILNLAMIGSFDDEKRFKDMLEV
jgi:hypothetical protein